MYAFRCPLSSVNWAEYQHCDHLHGKGDLVDKQVVEIGCGVVLTRQLLYVHASTSTALEDEAIITAGDL